MTVVGKDLDNEGRVKEPTPPAKRYTAESGVLYLARIGVWLAVVCFGGIFWTINGGFSVISLGVMAKAFNEAGALFWAAMTSITFNVPVRVPGLPLTQPLLPWLGVIAASFLQIAALYLGLRRRPIPVWLALATLLLSLYDYITSYYGLGTIAWIASAGLLFQVVLALFLTFTVEIIVSLILRR